MQTLPKFRLSRWPLFVDNLLSSQKSASFLHFKISFYVQGRNYSWNSTAIKRMRKRQALSPALIRAGPGNEVVADGIKMHTLWATRSLQTSVSFLSLSPWHSVSAISSWHSISTVPPSGPLDSVCMGCGKFSFSCSVWFCRLLTPLLPQ